MLLRHVHTLLHRQWRGRHRADLAARGTGLYRRRSWRRAARFDRARELRATPALPGLRRGLRARLLDLLVVAAAVQQRVVHLRRAARR